MNETNIRSFFVVAQLLILKQGTPFFLLKGGSWLTLSETLRSHKNKWGNCILQKKKYPINLPVTQQCIRRHSSNALQSMDLSLLCKLIMGFEVSEDCLFSSCGRF